jgi:subtilisin
MCCDYISGELILSFHRDDAAGRRLVTELRENRVDHVSYIESLDEKLWRVQEDSDKTLEFSLHRVKVPHGEEQWKVGYLHFFYKQYFLEMLGARIMPADVFNRVHSRSDFQFTVVPNSVLTLAGNSLGKDNVKAANFTFSPFHDDYKNLLGFPAVPPADLDQVNITIIDSGIAGDPPFTIAKEKNFVEPKNHWEVEDVDGHGTVIALIINDLCPSANISVFKVADDNGRISEWDIIAAVAACRDSRVINLSVQFGLEDRICRVCGRESQASRSAVFENIVNRFSEKNELAILVASAGNYGADELAFPARFSEVLAIGATNSQLDLWAESNYGNQNNPPGTADNHFVCPGGDDTLIPVETIGSFGSGDDWFGTSFATAYASGIVAHRIATLGTNADRTQIFHDLRNSAETNIIANYDPKLHGHGVLKF